MGEKIFKCTQCGECCKNLGEDNIVLLLPDDIRKLSIYFNVSLNDFCNRFLDTHGDFTHIYGKNIYQLQNHNGRCVFLDEKNLCTIHDVKPTQCREGPTHFMSKQMQRYHCMIHVDLVNTDQIDYLFFTQLLKEEI